MSNKIEVRTEEHRDGPKSEMTVFYWNVHLDTFNNKQSIKVVDLSSPKGKPQTWTSLDIRFNDEAIANRVAKALKHTIKLAGGKSEPF